jgi:hypothetical protein
VPPPPSGPYAQPGGPYAQPGGQYAQPGGQYAQPGGQYAQPGGQYAQPGAAYPPPAGPQRSRGLSITSFVLGLIGCVPFAALAAIVVGVVALVKRQALRGLAVAGIVLGLLWTIGGIAFFASGAASRLADSVQEAVDESSSGTGGSGAAGERIETFDLSVGDCFDDPAALEAPTEESFVSGDLVLLPCDEPHAFEVYHVSDAGSSEFPGEEALLDEVDEVCLDAFEPFIGLRYEESVVEVFYYYPTEDTWTALDDRAIVCAVTDGEATTGSLREVRR